MSGEKSYRIQQIYGYAVCLATIITMLIVVPGMVDAFMARSEPLREQGYRFGSGDSRGIASFELYSSLQPDRRIPWPAGSSLDSAKAAGTLSTEEQRQRYEVIRDEHIAQVRYSATRQLIRQGLLLLLAVGLFAAHWRWLRRFTQSD